MITHVPDNFVAPFRVIESIVERARKNADLRLGVVEAARLAIHEIGLVLARLHELEAAPTPISTGEVQAHMDALLRELEANDAAVDAAAAAKFAAPAGPPSPPGSGDTE